VCVCVCVCMCVCVCVCVAFVIQHAMRMRHIVICDLPDPKIFFPYHLMKGCNFRKKVTEQQYVF
jgi:hypothetical protein